MPGNVNPLKSLVLPPLFIIFEVIKATVNKKKAYKNFLYTETTKSHRNNKNSLIKPEK